MLRLARPLGNAARRQLPSRPFAQVSLRGYAERKEGMLSSDPSFRPEQPVPSTPTKTAAPITPPVPTTATPTSTTSIPPENVPKTPPPPPTKIQSTVSNPTPPPPSSSSSAPITPPPPPPKRRSRLRFLLYFIVLSALGYGGAVFYALRSDNFHDFFTEYIPFGEEAVLYFEERSFQKRFPNAQANTYRTATSGDREGKRVNIPAKSGISWRAVEEPKGGVDVTTKGKHMNAVDENSQAKEAPKTTSAPKKAEPKVESKPAAKESKPEPAAQPSPATPSLKSDPRPPAIKPVTEISAVSVANADEPVVQELVKLVNDLITVINADEATNTSKYAMPLQKAKDSVTSLATKIKDLRDAERAAAEERVKEAHKEFDEGAKRLLERIETAQREDDVKYREEFEQERAKIAQQYEQKLQAELERTKNVLEQRLHNELEEQGIKMKRKFIKDVQGLVEAERDGRLSKLSDLSSNVDSLTELTSNWNGIIDANLATQKLQVAVDAVRSALDDSNAQHRPAPFVREMAALKLVADSDSVVDAAVASVNPSAYQRGIPSSAQLIDRFRRVASEVRKASLLPENAGIASHAASAVLSRIMFKKQGVPEGNDVESILTRTETLLEEGNLDAAAREMNGLNGWAGVLSRDWLNDARKVLEVKQALDVIETEARLQCLRVE